MMIEHFLLKALSGGLFLAMMSGPLGALVLWQRLNFLGDTLSHAALFGVALALAWEWPLMAGIFLVTCLVISGFVLFQENQRQTISTTLSIFSQGMLALGIILVSILPVRKNIMSFLFGDLLTLTVSDIGTLFSCMVVVLFTIWYYWKAILKTVVSREIAAAEGVNVCYIQGLIVVLLGLCVAVASRLVGVLLVTSLFVIPAATARFIAKEPEGMVLWASVFAGCTVLAGVSLSCGVDLPTCPTITTVSLGGYLLMLLISLLKRV